jgi:hypothetical protein
MPDHDCLDMLELRCSGATDEWLQCARCGSQWSFDEAKQAAEDRLAAEMRDERRAA